MTAFNTHEKLLNKLSKYNVYSIIFEYMFKKGFIFHNDVRRINSGTNSTNPIKFLEDNNIIIKVDYNLIREDEEIRLLLRNGYGRYHFEEKTIFYTYTNDFLKIVKKNKLLNKISKGIKDRVKKHFTKYRKKLQEIQRIKELRQLEKQIKEDLNNIDPQTVENDINDYYNKQLQKPQTQYKQNRLKVQRNNSLKIIKIQSPYSILKDPLKSIKQNFKKLYKRKIHAEIFTLRIIISSYLAASFTPANEI